MMKQATSAGATQLVLPELELTGDTCNDLFFQQAVLIDGPDGYLSRRFRRIQLPDGALGDH